MRWYCSGHCSGAIAVALDAAIVVGAATSPLLRVVLLAGAALILTDAAYFLIDAARFLTDPAFFLTSAALLVVGAMLLTGAAP